MSRLARARRAHRPLARRHVHLRRQAASRRSRATRSPPRCTPAGAGSSRARSSTTARAARWTGRARARTRSCRSTARPASARASEVVRDGMVVEHQNAWPSLDFDVMRMSDIAGGPFTPPGFYYKTFNWPRRAWPLYERVLRGVAGLGRLPERQDDREWRTEYRRRHCDVLVIGGGIAGLSAAIAAARQGADVVLADDDVEPGGALLAEGGHERVRALADEARAAGVEVLSQRARARLLRRARPDLAGRHAAPGARAAPRRGDRRDRAAARLQGQRPARRDDDRRRAPPRGALGRAPGHDRGHRHDRRPRPRCRARAARGGCGDRRDRRPATGRRRPRARRRRAGRRHPRCWPG